MSVAILGAGAFGTALAVALSENGPVTLWARNPDMARQMSETRVTPRLPDVTLPNNIHVTSQLDDALLHRTLLLSTPMQSLSSLLNQIDIPLRDHALVACCKGLDLSTQTGPTAVIQRAKPHAIPAILTGPSFAADIARGLPTALTLACQDAPRGTALQTQLATPGLRLYRTTDVIGAELGGGLKNVMAIACGATIGAGMGDSARAALLTRGFAEMTRLSVHLGARPETLAGLSGFGDLALTCTSDLSRNYRYGQALGRGDPFDPMITVEGVKTAQAVCKLALTQGLDLPICQMVHHICTQSLSIAQAISTLLARPLKEE